MIDRFNVFEVEELLKVIKEVHSSIGDDNCWMDIDKIFHVAGLPIPDRKVGDKEKMFENCKRYINIMCSDGQWKSYSELEAENKTLKEQVDKFNKGSESLEKLLDKDELWE